MKIGQVVELAKRQEQQTFEGYHQFGLPDRGSKQYGSFQVFHHEGFTFKSKHGIKRGWYWWPCWPGCMPDCDAPTGPFPTAEGAYLDANRSV